MRGGVAGGVRCGRAWFGVARHRWPGYPCPLRRSRITGDPLLPGHVPVGHARVTRVGRGAAVVDVDDIATLGEVVEPDCVRGADVDATVGDVDQPLLRDRPGSRVDERAAVGDADVPVDL